MEPAQRPRNRLKASMAVLVCCPQEPYRQGTARPARPRVRMPQRQFRCRRATSRGCRAVPCRKRGHRRSPHRHRTPLAPSTPDRVPAKVAVLPPPRLWPTPWARLRRMQTRPTPYSRPSPASQADRQSHRAAYPNPWSPRPTPECRTLRFRSVLVPYRIKRRAARSRRTLRRPPGHKPSRRQRCRAGLSQARGQLAQRLAGAQPPARHRRETSRQPQPKHAAHRSFTRQAVCSRRRNACPAPPLLQRQQRPPCPGHPMDPCQRPRIQAASGR